VVISIKGTFGNISTSRGNFAVLKREFPVALHPDFIRLFVQVRISLYIVYCLEIRPFNLSLCGAK